MVARGGVKTVGCRGLKKKKLPLHPLLRGNCFLLCYDLLSRVPCKADVYLLVKTRVCRLGVGMKDAEQLKPQSA